MLLIILAYILLPLKVELVGAIQVAEGYNYNIISLSDSTLLAREFYTESLIIYDFNGQVISEMKLKKGRGPGEVALAAAPIKANSEFVFILDRVLHKVLKFSKSGLEYVGETLTPNAPWALVANDNVYIRSTSTKHLYNKVEFTSEEFSPLPNSEWSEPYNRFLNIYSFEAYDLASNDYLVMAKAYDASYYLYDLNSSSMSLIRYENIVPTDFSNSDFMGSLKLHVLNASLFDNGTKLAIIGNGSRSISRTYRSDRVHLFDIKSGKYIEEIIIPDVDIAQNTLVSNEKHFAFLDKRTNKILIYKYINHD